MDLFRLDSQYLTGSNVTPNYHTVAHIISYKLALPCIILPDLITYIINSRELIYHASPHIILTHITIYYLKFPQITSHYLTFLALPLMNSYKSTLSHLTPLLSTLYILHFKSWNQLDRFRIVMSLSLQPYSKTLRHSAPITLLYPNTFISIITYIYSRPHYIDI